MDPETLVCHQFIYEGQYAEYRKNLKTQQNSFKESDFKMGEQSKEVLV